MVTNNKGNTHLTVYQYCTKCRTEAVHMINKENSKLECIPCGKVSRFKKADRESLEKGEEIRSKNKKKNKK